MYSPIAMCLKVQCSFGNVSQSLFFHMKSSCRLDRMLHVNENIILQATLEEFEDSRDNMSFAMLQREKVSVGGGEMEEGRHMPAHQTYWR